MEHVNAFTAPERTPLILLNRDNLYHLSSKSPLYLSIEQAFKSTNQRLIIIHIEDSAKATDLKLFKSLAEEYNKLVVVFDENQKMSKAIINGLNHELQRARAKHFSFASEENLSIDQVKCSNIYCDYHDDLDAFNEDGLCGECVEFGGQSTIEHHGAWIDNVRKWNDL